MAGRLVNIALVGLLAGCTNIDIVRETDADLTCGEIEHQIDWMFLEGTVTLIENPFNLMFGPSHIHEAEEEREAHLRKIAQEKGCDFVDIVPAP